MKFPFFKHKHKVDYTHWDIHVMARILDPNAWAMFDAVHPGEPEEYMSFKPVQPSFNMAINALKSGIKATKDHMWSHEDVASYLKKQPK